jgi:signal transduction histidine kinase
MKALVISFCVLFAVGAYSQDTLVPSLDPQWVDPETQVDTMQVAKSNFITDLVEIVPKWFAPEPEPPKAEELSEADVKSIEEDVKFMEELPKSYDQLPKTDLRKAIEQIDQKIAQLTMQRDALLKEKVVNQKLVDAKNGAIKSLEKEKDIIGLTLESGDLKDENGNLVGQNDELKVEQAQLRRYLYIAIGVVLALALITAVILQRKRIQVQDVEIEEQIRDINKKNTYLEHAAHIIRHDMHSGINTYMPRGLSSLEKRITPDEIKNLKIEGALKMIKEGLTHTQKVYKRVYEFTNLVKQNVVLDRSENDLKELLSNHVANSSYSSQVEIGDLVTANVNEILFCNAIDNLIKNGLKYNDSEDKRVKIYMEYEHLVIQDNGRGLSQQQFEKVLFSYASKKTEADEEASGLGLNICQAILSEHGFEMSCEKIDVGTKMKIKLS